MARSRPLKSISKDFRKISRKISSEIYFWILFTICTTLPYGAVRRQQRLPQVPLHSGGVLVTPMRSPVPTSWGTGIHLPHSPPGLLGLQAGMSRPAAFSARTASVGTTTTCACGTPCPGGSARPSASHPPGARGCRVAGCLGPLAGPSLPSPPPARSVRTPACPPPAP